jgi:hypothetical protein
MSLEEKVSLTISVAKSYRDRLRTMAARQNLHDPDQLTSASTIAREIICEYIDEIDCIEADFQSTAPDIDPPEGLVSAASSEASTENLEGKRDEPCRTTAN